MKLQPKKSHIKIMEYFLAVALIYMSIILIAQIFCRALGYPLTWSEESARIASLWLTMLGAYLVARQDTHLKVEAFTDFLSGKPRLLLQIFIAIISGCCAAILTYYGTTTMIAIRYSVTPAMEIPFPVIFAATIIGSVFMLIYFVFETFILIKKIFIKTNGIA